MKQYPTSLKTQLEQSDQFASIPLFRSEGLSMQEETMLAYLIDFADYINNSIFKIEFLQDSIVSRRPGWSEEEVEKSLSGLFHKKIIRYSDDRTIALNEDIIKDYLLNYIES